MGFVAGMAVDSAGTLSTSYLGTSDVPAGATYINGFAFSADGALYICDWDDAPFYERGVARRADGAVYAVEAEPDVIYMGWGLSSRGELCVDASGTPSYYDEGIAVTDSGKIVVSEGVGGGEPPAWSPLALFASGEVGAWYDPSDLDTMFTYSVNDNNGHKPATLESQVALILDKSKGLVEGPELVTGSYSDLSIFTSVTGSVVYDATSGGVTLTEVGGVDAIARIGTTTDGVTVDANNWYVFRFELVDTDDTSAAISLALDKDSGGGDLMPTGLAAQFTNVGTWEIYIYATTTNVNVTITKGGGDNKYTTIRGISLKKIEGNHAYQATDASRPVLRARYNLLTYSEDFRNTADAGATRPWVYAVYTLTPSATTAPDGTMTATKIVMDSLTANKIQRLTHSITAFPFVANESRVVSCYMKAGEANWGVLGIDNNSGVYAGAYINLTTGAVTTYNAANLISGGITATAEDVGSGWYRLKVVITQGATPYGTAVHVKSSVSQPSGTSADVDGDGTSGIYVWGAQLNYGSTPLPYQRIAAATDYVTSSTMETYDFLSYLAFDNVDDYLVFGPNLGAGTGPVTYSLSYGPSIATDGFLFYHVGSGSPWVLPAQDGSISTTLTSSCTLNAAYMDNVLFTGVTRGDVYDALNPAHVVHIEFTPNANFINPRIGFYAGLSRPDAVYQVVARVGTMTSSDRTSLATYLASKAGVVL